MEQSINDFYTDYISGDLSRKEFEGLIYNHLVCNQEKTCLSHWKRDEYEDYLSWFYPRLHKAIDTYQDIGSSFEAFTARFLLISSKEYRGRITSNSITEYSAWSAQVHELYVHEEPPVYIHTNVENIFNNISIDRYGKKNTKHLLALILKCYFYISDDFAERIALRFGFDKRELLEKLKKMRRIRQDKDDDLYQKKERVNTQFLRCLVYERKMTFFNENTSAYNKLKQKRDKARERLDNMRRRMKNIRTEATNKQIAEVIGISKGTVDASLHRLKIRWKKMSLKADLN